MAPPGSSPTSLSTSPAPEGGQLIERPSFISADEDYDAADTPFQNEAHSLVRKGKARQIDHDITDTVSEETSHLQEVGSSVAYPPTSDGEAETRRVEETLKRWELAERQKRKAARGSISSTTPISNVSQRASLLWPNRKSRHPPDNGLGGHTILQSQETSDLPLRDIAASPTPSATSSPTFSSTHDFDNTNPNDPFANPQKPISPFADPEQAPGVHSSSRSSTRSTLAATTSSSLRPPTPKPLGLPPPRTPPPPIDSPPQRTPSPGPHVSISAAELNAKPTRWWHEWLCGCGEGSDRGGDYQAGRTNPFE